MALQTRLSAGAGSPIDTPRLELLDRFKLHCGGKPVPLPGPAQRLLAYVALRPQQEHRTSVAGALWMDTTTHRAAANLRTALWQIRKIGNTLIVTDGPYLRVNDELRVDFAELTNAAQQLISNPHVNDEPHVSAASLAKELLADWEEDWLLVEREQLRQVRLHALEALCLRLTRLGRHAQAIEAGLAGVAAEPLRETSQRALILAHLAEGNITEAVRQYYTYRSLLREIFGIEPRPELTALIAPCR